jgi:dTDP-4-dehydrorhamnose reductase
MAKILILGHSGMLGNAVKKYFDQETDHSTSTISNLRWDELEFKKSIINSDADYVINCIGLIPQNNPEKADYESLNVELPLFLDTTGKKILHPSTDCEFSGKIPIDKKYSFCQERDAEDAYGMSKARSSKILEESAINTKIIRTSIIGHELNSRVALLDWFLSSEGNVNGYTNHYWNGITTLEWAKIANELINDWENFPILNTFGTHDIRTKHDLLLIIKSVYKKKIEVIPFVANVSINKCLDSCKKLSDIDEQLAELKDFYSK